MMKRYIVATLSILISFYALAQNGIDSPYSRYGFGILSDRTTGFNKGMGGVSQGFRDGTSINLGNPASYSEVDSLSALFDLGISLQNGNYKMGAQQQNLRNCSFDGISFQFRAAKNVGLTVGLLPLSNINYTMSSLSEPIKGQENKTTSASYSGEGGLREVMLGAGWRPFKPISIGMNAGFIWGGYTHKMINKINNTSDYSDAKYYKADIATYNLQWGLQYIQPVSKTDKFVIGATYTYGHNINSDAMRETSTITSANLTVDNTIDTISNAFDLPHSFAAGLTYYHSENWRFGVDVELQKWSDCLFPDHTTKTYASKRGILNDKKKIAAGIDYTPRPYARALFKRSTYKLGGYYSQSYANATAGLDKPTEFGVSAGISMPMWSKWLIFSNLSKINVSAQWVHTNVPYLSTAGLTQGIQKKGFLKENYIRLCVGVSLNEHWFYKWKLQ